MCPQHQSQGFVRLPGVPVPQRSIFPLLVHFSHVIPVLCEWLACDIVPWRVGYGGVGDVEGVLEITGGVLLRYEKGIKVPETRFNKAGKVTKLVKVVMQLNDKYDRKRPRCIGEPHRRRELWLSNHCNRMPSV